MGVGPMEKMVGSSSSSSIVVFIIIVVFSGEVLHVRFIMRQHATREHIYLLAADSSSSSLKVVCLFIKLKNCLLTAT